MLSHVAIDLHTEVIVSRDELSRKLGHNAWRVLLILWQKCDHRGLTHITRIGISDLCNGDPNPAAVKRALARLKSAFLISPRGRWAESVPVGTSFADRDVFWHLVRGKVSQATAVVPKATSDWLLTANTRGGARPKAGRKSNCTDGTKRPARPAEANLTKTTLPETSRLDGRLLALGRSFPGPARVNLGLGSLKPKEPVIGRLAAYVFQTVPTPKKTREIRKLGASCPALDSLKSIKLYRRV